MPINVLSSNTRNFDRPYFPIAGDLLNIANSILYLTQNIRAQIHGNGSQNILVVYKNLSKVEAIYS